MTKISDHLAQAHDLPKGGTLKGHKIIVEGLYFAFVNGEKVSRKYREEFMLKAHEHRVHGQGALGHILSDKLLAERLSKKDPEFRAIKTHIVVAHENIAEHPALKVGDKVLLPTGIANDTGVIVDIHADKKQAAVKLDVNGNVSPFYLSDLVKAA